MTNNELIDATTVSRFHALFDGLQRIHGTYDLTGAEPDERGKRKGKALTLKQPITDELVGRHLAGKQSLGMVPVRDDATVRFGAIDIDVYADLDASAIAGRLVQESLPLVPCQSKSGGLHLYLFTSEPVPAAAMRKRLTEIKAMLGLASTGETFPRQDKLAPEEKGSWINLPFFGDTRPAIRPDGEALTLEQFLDLAERMRVDKRFFGKSEATGVCADGPPCLNHLVKIGVRGSGSNTTLFNLGVYAKRAFHESWETEVEKLNQEVLNPPLSSAEVVSVIKSLGKKEKSDGYGYQCSMSPLTEHCDKALCRTRRYGVGSSGAVCPVLGTLTKYDSVPPTYRFEVDGVLIPLNADQLFTCWQFKRECQMALNRVMPNIKQMEWDKILSKALEQMDIQDMSDVSPEAVFWEHLEAYCEWNGNRPESGWEEIKRGHALTSNGRTYFSMAGLQRWLDSRKFKACTSQEIAAILKQRGAEQKLREIAGKDARVWSIPAFPERSNPEPVPDAF